MSRSWLEEVKITTGTSCVLGSLLMALSTSKPLTLGNFKSRRMSRSNGTGPAPKNCRTCSPSRKTLKRWGRLWAWIACKVSFISDWLSSTSNISTCSLIGSFSADVAYSKTKCGPLVRLGLSPDAPAVPGNDAVHTGQSHSCTLKFFLQVQSLKHSKEFIGIFHVKPYSIVTDPKNRVSVLHVLAYLNESIRPGAGEFDGIRKQVAEYLGNQLWITLHRRKPAHPPFHLPCGCFLAQIEDHPGHQGIHVHHLPGYLLAPQPGEIQQVIHQAAHVLGPLPDLLQAIER